MSSNESYRQNIRTQSWQTSRISPRHVYFPSRRIVEAIQLAYRNDVNSVQVQYRFSSLLQ